MKTSLIIGILVLGLSGQAMSMGHPHNVFAARKQMKAKASMAITKTRSTATVCWQPTVELSKSTLSKRFVQALVRMRSTQAY
ncbi:hypothetical protein [Spirosoma fluminis]